MKPLSKFLHYITTQLASTTSSITTTLETKQTQKTTQNAPPFRLLSLPIELRLLIYAHVFSFPPVIVTASRSKLFLISSSSSSSSSSSDGRQISPDQDTIASTIYTYTPVPKGSIAISLLHTSKQIYFEALPVLYDRVIFTHDLAELFLLSLLGRMSDYARDHVRCVRLQPRQIVWAGRSPATRERLAWMQLCARIAELKGLRKVEVVCPRAEVRCDEVVTMERIGGGLRVVKVRKEVVVEGGVEESWSWRRDEWVERLEGFLEADCSSHT
ncbi:hypothetical protein ASPBRDRAFT_386750 [Aspergillus brasiliensis CBS 101740]|uniref:DUF7730 domain-containing protein n=1 Tax=Aspergillus brasiliensis (strain CBS 101740 / IMI 381727 / IBT 21946) TaxID=767769 RepID=A0A1L9UW44_ASPBC|nr:hypothetical protein ASPBRDRAFT_386750 [Aspergillus brasiliensis CBS 101740]